MMVKPGEQLLHIAIVVVAVVVKLARCTFDMMFLLFVVVVVVVKLQAVMENDSSQHYIVFSEVVHNTLNPSKSGPVRVNAAKSLGRSGVACAGCISWRPIQILPL